MCASKIDRNPAKIGILVDQESRISDFLVNDRREFRGRFFYYLLYLSHHILFYNVIQLGLRMI